MLFDDWLRQVIMYFTEINAALEKNIWQFNRFGTSFCFLFAKIVLQK